MLTVSEDDAGSSVQDNGLIEGERIVSVGKSEWPIEQRQPFPEQRATDRA